jgi:hypothetical protein
MATRVPPSLPKVSPLAGHWLLCIALDFADARFHAGNSLRASCAVPGFKFLKGRYIAQGRAAVIRKEKQKTSVTQLAEACNRTPGCVAFSHQGELLYEVPPVTALVTRNASWSTRSAASCAGVYVERSGDRQQLWMGVQESGSDRTSRHQAAAIATKAFLVKRAAATQPSATAMQQERSGDNSARASLSKSTTHEKLVVTAAAGASVSGSIWGSSQQAAASTLSVSRESYISAAASALLPARFDARDARSTGENCRTSAILHALYRSMPLPAPPLEPQHSS